MILALKCGYNHLFVGEKSERVLERLHEQERDMRKYRDFVAEIMNDPAEAAEYLRASLSEYSDGGNLEAFLTAVRSVAEARD